MMCNTPQFLIPAMKFYSRQKNFSVRLKPDLDEEFSNYIELSGGNRNALINKAVKQLLEKHPNKEPSEVI